MIFWFGYNWHSVYNRNVIMELSLQSHKYVSYRVVPLQQEAYLNLSEKEMNKHNARICGTQDCQDARGSF
jgi:hypothetical protein